MTCFRIDVSSTKLLTTFPTPRLATTGTNIKIFAIARKSTRKNVITRVIFETPPLTPGTLLGVHLVWGPKEFWDFKQICMKKLTNCTSQKRLGTR
jgi:hypothetical protein